MGGTLYGNGSADERAAAIHRKTSTAAEAFGPFASRISSSGARQSTVEGPSATHQGIKVVTRFTHDADGSGWERLVTVRPAEVNGLRPVQLVKIVAHELAAFVEGASPTEDANESLAVLGAAPGVPAVLHVDRRRLEAWSLRVGDARGIVCRNGDRAMMWLGVGGKVPTLIFTEDLADALRRISPTKMAE